MIVHLCDSRGVLVPSGPGRRLGGALRVLPFLDRNLDEQIATVGLDGDHDARDIAGSGDAALALVHALVNLDHDDPVRFVVHARGMPNRLRRSTTGMIFPRRLITPSTSAWLWGTRVSSIIRLISGDRQDLHGELLIGPAERHQLNLRPASRGGDTRLL